MSVTEISNVPTESRSPLLHLTFKVGRSPELSQLHVKGGGRRALSTPDEIGTNEAPTPKCAGASLFNGAVG